MPTATRLFVPQDLLPDQPVQASAEQAHYLSRVLRLNQGTSLTLFNGRDGEWRAEIISLSKNAGTFALLEQLRPQLQGPDLWLAFAPVKKAETDYIIEKATELGVSRLIPTLTDFTQTDRVRTDRLLATATEASEQSERLDRPEILEPLRLDTLINTWPAERTLYLCAEAGAAPPLAETIQNSPQGQPVGFVTGPAGGFSPTELDLFRRNALVHPVSLGPRILRAETAAVAALSVWQALAGDWQQRPPHRD